MVISTVLLFILVAVMISVVGKSIVDCAETKRFSMLIANTKVKIIFVNKFNKILVSIFQLNKAKS